jgi:hypothetical protein
VHCAIVPTKLDDRTRNPGSFRAVFFRLDLFSTPVFAQALFFGGNENAMGIGGNVNNWTNDISTQLK